MPRYYSTRDKNKKDRMIAAAGRVLGYGDKQGEETKIIKWAGLTIRAKRKKSYGEMGGDIRSDISEYRRKQEELKKQLGL